MNFAAETSRQPASQPASQPCSRMELVKRTGGSGYRRTQRPRWTAHSSVQRDLEVASGAWVGDRRDFNVVTELVGERLCQGIIVSFVASSSTVLNGNRGESHVVEVVVVGGGWWRRF